MGDTVADTSALANLSNQARVSNAIAYVSPNLSGFTLSAAAVQTDTKSQFDDADEWLSSVPRSYGQEHGTTLDGARSAGRR